MKPPAQRLIPLRFAAYLAWEFRWSLAVFTALVLLGGLALHLDYDERPLDYAEACWSAFQLIFMQSNLAFPDEWYWWPFFFLVPIIGLGALADSLVRLGILVFAKKRDLPEWQRIMASAYRNHIIVVGAGKVGLRIIRGLAALKEPVVAIERLAESTFLDEVHDLHVPVIVGSCRQAKTLEQAGVRSARSIILATDDDLANLDGALTARDLNPNIRVVMRLFDDTLATKIGGAFQLPAISTSRVAAPAFIAAATGKRVYHDFQLDGHLLHLTDLAIEANGRLAGQTVGQVQNTFAINIVMHKGDQGVTNNPGHEIPLKSGDTILVMAVMEKLTQLEAANRKE